MRSAVTFVVLDGCFTGLFLDERQSPFKVSGTKRYIFVDAIKTVSFGRSRSNTREKDFETSLPFRYYRAGVVSSLIVHPLRVQRMMCDRRRFIDTGVRQLPCFPFALKMHMAQPAAMGNLIAAFDNARFAF